LDTLGDVDELLDRTMLGIMGLDLGLEGFSGWVLAIDNKEGPGGGRPLGNLEELGDCTPLERLEVGVMAVVGTGMPCNRIRSKKV
jgi:hypothetical protein